MCMESAPPHRDSNRLIVCKARLSLLYVLIKLQADWMTPMATKLAPVIDNLLFHTFQCVSARPLLEMALIAISSPHWDSSDALFANTIANVSDEVHSD